MENTFKTYGSDFQLILLRLLVEDWKFAREVKEILEPSYFDNKYDQWLCKTALDHIAEYRALPSFKTLEFYIEEQIPEKQHKAYKSALKSVESATLKERSFIITQAIDFCFKRNALQNLEKGIELVKQGEYDQARLSSRIAFKPMDSKMEVFDLKRDYKQIYNSDNHQPVPTPFPTFNLFSQEGPSKGTLAVAVASSNFGKTAWLTAIARNAVQRGQKVVYISLETATYQIAKRFIAGLIGIDQEDLINHPQKVDQAIEDLTANVRFYKFKSRSASIETIHNLLEDLKAEGFFADLICVDYLQLLKVPKSVGAKNDNEKIEYICEGLREDIGEEHNVLVWTAQQTNRGGFDKLAVDHQNISRAIESFFIADWFIIFSQLPKDHDDKIAYVVLLKNRFGKRNVALKIYYDPNQGLFQELEVMDRALMISQEQSQTIQKGIGAAQKFLEQKKVEHETRVSQSKY